ncbi:hypothetical protein [Fulvimonas soli]|jgi:hypothetical protein|uniref:Uncharacterized protein n=1 Tax=Fulvimonas soli TaxID=155197 RepID=A0A316HTV9_9GAMM|nr:hypothetical protein [Fulvimonas soli]PWK83869.1 hypothetical protein C7456_11216 [Fulvimonas soli]TNY25246.1 hypothetical protein BV497_14860 [Fulvimonas soli]
MKLLRESVFWRLLRGRSARAERRSYTVTVPAPLPASNVVALRPQEEHGARAVVSTVAVRRAAGA